jgi:hypothetical protein
VPLGELSEGAHWVGVRTYDPCGGAGEPQILAFSIGEGERPRSCSVAPGASRLSRSSLAWLGGALLVLTLVTLHGRTTAYRRDS